ncbi:opine metallophore biosynthesis dehydrogenase [Paenibacillus sp. GSMTC-2017]|uniref:opine metallophore biosynthesis dehydrogenase n=1 Tax=Paenibacillus sp. GSMTC-2017 TaxID=2794350 RepID=UPI0018D7262C|nr:opine metallophore biosynthesis dehydrogenase [Paenibacillus sp. GSMTC-2017]MBH5316433.1 opine metallophore biosynthesis dehydrogenase [Paenibacillus sp. GSMTC-2017]
MMGQQQLALFENVLIIGAGPAAIHVAVDISNGWCNQVGIANRIGSHSERIKQELERCSGLISTVVQVESKSHLSGTAQLSQFYEGFEHIDNVWQTIIVCTPCDTYLNVVKELKLKELTKVKRIILLSPGIGSNLLVQSVVNKSNDAIEIISLSTYYAATRFDPQGTTLLTSIVKGLKRKVVVGSNQSSSHTLNNLKVFIESLGITCEIAAHPIEAESRSITAYVHPPFFINDFSLHEIFSKQRSTKYMYKLYPEGPITQYVIKEMLLLWKETSAFIQKLHAQPLNLLKFLNDDNYPVHETTLSREDIESFVDMDETKQQYLLYIRYSSILIDPFSKPDEKGKYTDFSAFPYVQVSQDKEGKWIIPRVPYEDYKKLKLMYGLAQRFDVAMPQTCKLIDRFEQKLSSFVEEKGSHTFRLEMITDTTADEVNAIVDELSKVNKEEGEKKDVYSSS